MHDAAQPESAYEAMGRRWLGIGNIESKYWFCGLEPGGTERADWPAIWAGRFGGAEVIDGRMEAGDPNHALREDLDQMLVEKAAEVGARLVDFAEERFDLDGTRRVDLDRIFPVVVVIEPMLTELGVAQDTESRVAGEPGLEHAETLQILDIEGLEALGLPLQQGALLSEILSAKLKDPATAVRGMKDYLVERGYEVSRTPEINARFAATQDSVFAQAAAFGVPGADEAG